MTGPAQQPDDAESLRLQAEERAKAAAARAAERKRKARAKAKEEAQRPEEPDAMAAELATIDRKEVLEETRAWVEESREELRERVEAAAAAHGADKREADKLVRRCRAGFLEVRLIAWGLRHTLAKWGPAIGAVFPLMVLGLGLVVWALAEWRLRRAIAAAEKRWEKLRSPSSSGPEAPASPTRPAG